ncbi:Aspartyl/glutamyl-tRNA(Asn/Gln) amidotransferase subunit C [Nymphon striatum]|nr:Aspartyl/glutamyl-tRNA(Asn/Gln) amidotransferase subunit C [Nymphon striatum]
MSVDIDTVKRVAKLSRIAVDDAKAEKMQGELNAIFGFIDQLNEVDVEGVEPMTSVVQMDMRKRVDEITAVELTDSYLTAIEEANKTLNAYIVVTPEDAKKSALQSDEKIAKGEAGALEGIPVGIKDLFGTNGVHTQALLAYSGWFQAKIRIYRYPKHVG